MHFCRLAAIGYSLGLLCDLGDLVDANVRKTLSRLISVLIDAATLYMWLNVIYLLERLRPRCRRDWFGAWNALQHTPDGSASA